MHGDMARPPFSQAEVQPSESKESELKEEGPLKSDTAEITKEEPHVPSPVRGPPVLLVVPLQGFPILMGEVVVPLWSLGQAEDRLLTTWALAQGVKVLAFLDAVILIIQSVSLSSIRRHWGVAIVAFIWGPFTGFLGAQTYNPWLASVFVTYYFARMAVDILIVVEYEAYWFIVGIVSDVIIATFVARFAILLWNAKIEELEFLRHPDQARQLIAPKVQPYFVLF